MSLPPREKDAMAIQQGQTAETGISAAVDESHADIPPGEMEPEEATSPQGQPSNVADDEQQQYEKFVKESAALIYNEKTLPSILESLSIKSDPKEALATTIASVVMRMEDGYEQKGEKVPPDILMHGGLEVGELLAEMQEAIGIVELQQEEMDGVALRAMDIYRENRQKQGKLNEEAIKEDFNTIVQADKAGRIDDVLPGATEYAKRVQGVDAQGSGIGPKRPPNEEMPMAQGQGGMPQQMPPRGMGGAR